MTTRNTNKLAAIPVMAVLLLVLILGGCATSRQVDELKADVEGLRSQNQEVLDAVRGMKTSAQEEAESNQRMRNDVNMTVDQLEEQLATLQESYNDLMQRIDAIFRIVNERKSLRSSPGATQPVQEDVPIDAPPTTNEPASIDCAATYDDAFILVRRGEYENAITTFQTFLKDCESHELAENAHYWIGESYYSLERFDEAVTQLEQLLENYRSSVNTSRAIYKLARSKQELGKNDEARVLFQQLVDEHAGTLEAEQAAERLKDL